MKIVNKLEEASLMKIYDYLEKNPEKNMSKIMDIVDKLDTKNTFEPARNFVRTIVNDPDNIWYHYIVDLLKDTDKEVGKTIFKNFIINAGLKGYTYQNELKEKYDCNIPWAILLDPTSACNLKCTGCWAAEYGHQLQLDFNTIDRIITQGKELGIYFYIYTGGEPLVRKKDLMDLCRKHNDCIFLAFTNSTLIDEKFADEMLEVKNFIPAISVEGFQVATDSRRGNGVFDQVMSSMELLK